MASLVVVFCAILPLFNIVCGNVPVLLWESSKSDRVNSFPALHRIKSEDFQQYVLKKIHGEQPVPLIAMFAEESLSLEDYSWQDSQGQGYFPQLKYIVENSLNQEFLPSVQDPIEATKGLLEFGYTVQYIDSNNFNLPDGCGKILIIKLQDAKPDEDRPDLLRRHDVEVSDMYSQLLSKCSHVIGFLAGQHSSWVEPEEVTRMRRSADNSTNSSSLATPVIIASPKAGTYITYQDTNRIALVYSDRAPVLTYEDKETDLANFSTVVSGDNSKPTDIRLFVKYKTDYRVAFNFDNKSSGYWYLRSVSLEVGTTPEIILKSNLDIYAPLSMSFHSGSPVTFRNGSTAFTFVNLQIQPFFSGLGLNSFSEAVDAVEFFTPAIWSGIFVTFLLALIFTWGISMIMDIRTMDQFDDPKGKTITVSATE